MDSVGNRAAFGWQYISYWGYIKLNVDIPDNQANAIALKKGSYTIAIIAEDPDGNLKAKVLNPSKLFDSSFVILSKPATQSDGEGDFDHMADVPVEANYETAKMRQGELTEQEKWQNGEYDELMLIENEGPMH